MKKLGIWTIFLLFSFAGTAQQDTDSIVPELSNGDTASSTTIQQPKPAKTKRRAIVKDTTLVDSSRIDSVATFPSSPVTVLPNAAKATTVVKQSIDTFYQKLLSNPFFRYKKQPVYLVIKERQRTSKDEMFYLLSGLLIMLAFIKLVFNRYFSNVFKIFIQPAFRQKQTREQLLHSNLPSVFLNLFFIFSGGAYIALLANYFGIMTLNFWQVFFYSAAALFLLYFFKYIVLSFAGWVFNAKEAIDTYAFVVYLINKIIGVVLIPFILLIAFGQTQVVTVAVTVSLVVVAFLFLYRYIASLAPVKREVKVATGHFFLYILAVEIIPLLLIYKSLIIYLNNTH